MVINRKQADIIIEALRDECNFEWRHPAFKVINRLCKDDTALVTKIYKGFDESCGIFGEVKVEADSDGVILYIDAPDDDDENITVRNGIAMSYTNAIEVRDNINLCCMRLAESLLLE